MLQKDELAGRIGRLGFNCKRCGSCCTMASEDSNLVLVGAPEVRMIMDATGLSWDDIAEPYPEVMKTAGGAEFTLSWCLRRDGNKCIFLGPGSRCTIYDDRPLICRTYPFMLDGDELMVFECPGIGSDMTEDEADAAAEDLLKRAELEEADLEKTRNNFDSAKLSGKRLNVIDSEGVKTVG